MWAPIPEIPQARLHNSVKVRLGGVGEVEYNHSINHFKGLKSLDFAEHERTHGGFKIFKLITLTTDQRMNWKTRGQ